MRAQKSFPGFFDPTSRKSKETTSSVSFRHSSRRAFPKNPNCQAISQKRRASNLHLRNVDRVMAREKARQMFLTTKKEQEDASRTKTKKKIPEEKPDAFLMDDLRKELMFSETVSFGSSTCTSSSALTSFECDFAQPGSSPSHSRFC